MTYPTPEAYEAACHALERHRARADQAQARADELQQLLDLKNEQQRITRVIRDTIWRIHGPDSTDEEGAEMDAENIVCALEQAGLIPEGHFEKETQFGWVADNDEVIQFATHKPQWPDVPSIRVNGKVRRVMKRTKITGISRWIEVENE